MISLHGPTPESLWHCVSVCCSVIILFYFHYIVFPMLRRPGWGCGNMNLEVTEGSHPEAPGSTLWDHRSPASGSRCSQPYTKIRPRSRQYGKHKRQIATIQGQVSRPPKLLNTENILFITQQVNCPNRVVGLQELFVCHVYPIWLPFIKPGVWFKGLSDALQYTKT